MKLKCLLLYPLPLSPVEEGCREDPSACQPPSSELWTKLQPTKDTVLSPSPLAMGTGAELASTA